MPRIKDASVDAVKNAADIVAVVEGRTTLRKTGGGSYMGRCPFHEERTGSFSVSAAKGTYYCFGCGVGGDTIRFVQETEGVDFVGAIEWLADRFNVPLEYEESSPGEERRRTHRRRLLELLGLAATFYERHLWDSPAAGAARDYVTGQRALGEEVCREFRLGFAPGGSILTRKALEKGFTREELAAAGLSNRRGNDYFGGRLVFPLADGQGKVLGFQARRLREDDPVQAKYVNSPESELFKKGDLLYGLDLAKSTIAREDRAIVVEGNVDAIALRQVGLKAVVASMGTALTERQLKELKRTTRTRRIWLCFDGDAAGEAATLRGMELAVGEGLEVKVVTLPPELDPADVADRFEPLLARADPYLVHRVRLELDRSHDRQHAYLRVQELLNAQADSPERQEAWRLANDRLGLTVQLRAAGGTTGASGRAASPRLIEGEARDEREALAGVVKFPRFKRILEELGPEHFQLELHRRAREHLLHGGEADEELVALLAELDALAAVEELDPRSGTPVISERVAEELLLKLRERRLRQELQSADPARAPELRAALLKIREAVAELV
jgi:DNA primase